MFGTDFNVTLITAFHKGKLNFHIVEVTNC